MSLVRVQLEEPKGRRSFRWSSFLSVWEQNLNWTRTGSTLRLQEAEYREGWLGEPKGASERSKSQSSWRSQREKPVNTIFISVYGLFCCRILLQAFRFKTQLKSVKIREIVVNLSYRIPSFVDDNLILDISLRPALLLRLWSESILTKISSKRVRTPNIVFPEMWACLDHPL